MESANTLFEVEKDGWIHITPLGEFPHRSGIVQVIDLRAVGEIVKSFDAKREVEGETFAGVLLDYDHFRHTAGRFGRCDREPREEVRPGGYHERS